MADRTGLDLTGYSSADPTVVFLEHRTGAWSQGMLRQLEAMPSVQEASVSTTGAYAFDFSVNDPYVEPDTGGQGNFGQWHLDNTFNPGLDVNVQSAWNDGVTGRGVTIGVVDDGVEGTHPDLQPNFNASVSHDFADDDPDPAPESGDGHGVSVAGLAAARGGNGTGVAGVAPEADLAGLRVQFGRESTSQQVFDATIHASDRVDVQNHSCGSPFAYVPDGGAVLANRRSAAQGVVNVRAAGNSAANANARAAQAEAQALTVAALSMDGEASSCSNFGANVFVTAPSSDTFDLPGLMTTDRTGTAGYNAGNPTFDDPDYNHAFGGTSGAAPIVSGAVAQIKQVNPDLGGRGVKHVLAETSRKVDPGDDGWQTNAAGYEFNPEYGFGLVDVSAAVDFAEDFEPMPQQTFTTGEVAVNEPIPDFNPFTNQADPVELDFQMAGRGAIETVELWIEADHAFPGDFKLTLESPAGTESQLASPTFFSKRWDDNVFTLDLQLERLLG